MTYHLTDRERQVLDLVWQGYSVADISTTLFISQRTTGNHLTTIRDKLGAQNRIDMVRIALQAGFLHVHNGTHAVIHYCPTCDHIIKESDHATSKPHPYQSKAS